VFFAHYVTVGGSLNNGNVTYNSGYGPYPNDADSVAFNFVDNAVVSYNKFYCDGYLTAPNAAAF